jgi:hypothetical protein
MRRTRTTLWIALVIAGTGLFASARQRIDSQWRDREIAVDGDSGDWPGPLRPLEDKHPIVAAASNDDQFLYVVLSTSDAAVRRQILRQGLTVWFDPGGGDKKHFGIKFPVGGLGQDAPARQRGGFREPRGGGSSDPGGQTPQADQLDPPNRLEIYGPQKGDAHSFVTEMAPGIAVKIGQAEGRLVYELKVPLTRTADRPYAIEAKPGAALGLGLETPKAERPQGPGFGGFGGRGGMGGRGMGGGRGRESDRFEPPKPLKLWATIQLAAR